MARTTIKGLRKQMRKLQKELEAEKRGADGVIQLKKVAEDKYREEHYGHGRTKEALEATEKSNRNYEDRNRKFEEWINSEVESAKRTVEQIRGAFTEHASTDGMIRLQGRLEETKKTLRMLSDIQKSFCGYSRSRENELMLEGLTR